MDKYIEQREKLEKNIKELDGRSSTYSVIRLCVFIAAVACLIIGIYDSRGIVTVVGMAASVVLLHWYLFMESWVKILNTRRRSQRYSEDI